MVPTTKKSKTSTTSAPAGAADEAAERLRLEKAREGGWSDLPGSVHGWIVEAIDEYKQGAGTGRAGKESQEVIDPRLRDVKKKYAPNPLLRTAPLVPNTSKEPGPSGYVRSLYELVILGWS